MLLPLGKPSDGADKANGADGLPEFLKQRLKARGILKDETANKNSTTKQNASSNSLTSIYLHFTSPSSFFAAVKECVEIGN